MRSHASAYKVFKGVESMSSHGYALKTKGLSQVIRRIFIDGRDIAPRSLPAL
jgi:hypothetical protein